MSAMPQLNVAETKFFESRDEEFAQSRCFTPKAKRNGGKEETQDKIAAGLQAAGGKLYQGG